MAREYYEKTIAQAEKIQDLEMVEDAYHGLGTLYDIVGDYEQAIQHYLRSIDIAKKRENKAGIITSYKNISESYVKAKEYNKALESIKKTYQIALTLGDSLQIAAVLYAYGTIEMEVKDYQPALTKLNNAKIVFERLHEKPCLAESYWVIGQVYFRIQN